MLVFKLHVVKGTGYCEWVWFKNYFAKVFSAYYFDAGITTTIISMPFRSLWGKLVLQESVRSYFTQAQRYSEYTVQIFAVRFLNLCASLRPVFLITDTAEGPTRAFLNNRSSCQKIQKRYLSYLKNLSRSCNILETETDITKKLSSFP